VVDRLIPMRFGGVEVLVGTRTEAGSERTSAASDLAAKVVDVFEDSKEVIAGVARSTADLLGEFADGVTPDRLEIEFGLSFTAKGNVIVAGASAEATLKVKLVYDGASS